jgi:hypothetical protein
MASETGSGGHRRRDRVLGGVGQVAGIVGIVLCLLLVVGSVLGRGWAIGTVDNLSARVDQGIGRAVPPLTTASSLVGDVSQRIGDVATAADAVAAQPTPSNDALANLQSKLQVLSDRYLELRTTYANVRQEIASVITRIEAVDALLPRVDLPHGPIDALQALDAKIQQVDAAIMSVINANLVGNAVDSVAGQISARAKQAEANLQGVSDKISGIATNLQALQSDLDAKASTAKTVITLSTVGAVLLFLYLALLHLILFRVSRRLWITSRGSAPAADAPPAPDAPPADVPPGDDSPTEPVAGTV